MMECSVLRMIKYCDKFALLSTFYYRNFIEFSFFN
jgi:hypothetical protein